MQEQDWKLPFFVEWRTPGNGDDRVFGVLRPALSLYPTQLLTIQRLLGSYALEDRNDRWILPKAVVHAMLIKAQGITPEFNYKWMEEGCPAVPAQRQQSLDARRLRIARSYCLRSFGFRYWYRSTMSSMRRAPYWTSKYLIAC